VAIPEEMRERLGWLVRAAEAMNDEENDEESGERLVVMEAKDVSTLTPAITTPAKGWNWQRTGRRATPAGSGVPTARLTLGERSS
jgi:hypothetical protein